jgi:hypothetical protein
MGYIGMSKIHAVIFEKKYWTPTRAEQWLSAHKLDPIKDVDVTTNFLRYRIRDPDLFDYFRMISLPNRAKLVIGFTQHQWL